MQITEQRAAVPARQPASPRSFCSPEYNFPLVHKGNKGEMFNSCSTGQDKCKHFSSDNLQTWGEGDLSSPRPNDIQYYLVKNRLYNRVCVCVSMFLLQIFLAVSEDNTVVSPVQLATFLSPRCSRPQFQVCTRSAKSHSKFFHETHLTNWVLKLSYVS